MRRAAAKCGVMRNLKTIFQFGWPYMRRYKGRVIAGLLLGILFGISNASFVWATKTLFERLKSPVESQQITLINTGGGDVSWQAKSPQDKSSTGTNGTLAAGQTVTIEVAPPATTGVPGGAGKFVDSVQASVLRWLDRWLPKMGRENDWRQMAGGFLFLPLLVAIRSFIGYLSSYCVAWVSERVMNDLRYDMLEQLYRLSLDFFNRSKMGDLLTRINNDTAWLYKAMTYGMSDIMKEPFTIVGIVAALFVVSPKLTLLALVFLPFTLAPLIILGRKVRRAAKESLKANISQSSLLVEALAGIRVIKAFGLEADSLLRFKTFSQKIIHHNMKGVQAKELVNPLVETISMLGLGSLIVVIFISRSSLPDLAAFLMGVVLIYTPVRKLAAVHVTFQQASPGVDRLASIMKEQPTVKEPAEPKPLKAFEKGIELDNVTFAYEDKQVLNGLTLNIPRGFKLGIAGESGSGKSTLVNLLFRFYDVTGGSIRIDGNDLREVAQRDLQQLMALVSQEVVIFDMSVRGNIGAGRKGATHEEIEAAAKAAFAHEFIMQLPQGYDTQVGERGVTLSGGQRQRVAIARAFVRNAPILLLDEATASLDSRVEAEVQKAIEQLERNRTVVCIAHRLSTLVEMDRILVLAEGRVVEEGTFDELLARKGVFANMAARQGIGI